MNKDLRLLAFCNIAHSRATYSKVWLFSCPLCLLLTISAAPCLISNVQTQLDCTANSLAVQWAGIAGNKFYIALAIGTDGTRTSCNTSNTFCTIQSLRCGRRYSIAVTTWNNQCTIQGSDLQIQTGMDWQRCKDTQ